MRPVFAAPVLVETRPRSSRAGGERRQLPEPGKDGDGASQIGGTPRRHHVGG